MNISGVFIPYDEEQPIKVIDIPRGEYTAIQAIIGGVFGVINIGRPTPSSIFIHDEGKIVGLPLNRRATMLLWASDSRWWHQDVIMGDAFILGPPDDEGDTTGIPEDFKQLLLDTEEYKMEVQTTGSGDAWAGNQLRFNDPFDALNYVLGLAERWHAVEQVRIVPA